MRLDRHSLTVLHHPAEVDSRDFSSRYESQRAGVLASTKKQIPEFRSEEERGFWGERDSTEFIDWKAAKRSRFPKSEPFMKSFYMAVKRIC